MNGTGISCYRSLLASIPLLFRSDYTFSLTVSSGILLSLKAIDRPLYSFRNYFSDLLTLLLDYSLCWLSLVSVALNSIQRKWRPMNHLLRRRRVHCCNENWQKNKHDIRELATTFIMFSARRNNTNENNWGERGKTKLLVRFVLRGRIGTFRLLLLLSSRYSLNYFAAKY